MQEWSQRLNLQTEELEKAFQVVETAWKQREYKRPNLEVPEELQHLTPMQWEEVGEMLLCLEDQRDHSLIH